MSELRDMLRRDEGVKLKPYVDPVSGLLHIGIGRCLVTVGISKAEAEYLLENDITAATRAAQTYPWFWDLSFTRQDVIVAMHFVLGPEGFAKFPRMISALALGHWGQAADELLNSAWRKQATTRVEELASMMRLDRYPEKPNAS